MIFNYGLSNTLEIMIHMALMIFSDRGSEIFQFVWRNPTNKKFVALSIGIALFCVQYSFSYKRIEY